MTARTKSKVSPTHKRKYRVKSRAVYEEALRERGDITVMFGDGCIIAAALTDSGRHQYRDSTEEDGHRGFASPTMGFHWTSTFPPLCFGWSQRHRA